MFTIHFPAFISFFSFFTNFLSFFFIPFPLAFPIRFGYNNTIKKKEDPFHE